MKPKNLRDAWEIRMVETSAAWRDYCRCPNREMWNEYVRAGNAEDEAKREYDEATKGYEYTGEATNGN